MNIIKTYRTLRAKLIYQLFINEKWCEGWTKWLFMSFNRLGIQFWYKREEILWLWPWFSKGKAPFISIAVSRDSFELGDIRFENLSQIDEFWKEYEEYIQANKNLIK